MTDSRFRDTRSPLIVAVSAFVFRVLRFLAAGILKHCFNFTVKSTYCIPAAGPFIIIANHESFMDFAVLQAACPLRIVFLMTETYYNPILVRWFFDLMCCIPLNENTPYNIRALRRALEALNQGTVVGIFPEGSISREGVLRDAMPGTLLLAQKTGAPIVPAYIEGTYEALPRHAKFFRKATISVSFGEPLDYHDLAEGATGKEGLQAATRNLMKHIVKLAGNFKTD